MGTESISTVRIVCVSFAVIVIFSVVVDVSCRSTVIISNTVEINKYVCGCIIRSNHILSL